MPFGSDLTLNYNVPKASVSFAAYFLGEVSKDVAKNLNNLIHKYYPQVNWKKVGYHRLRFCFKDRMPVDCMSCHIFKYTCDSCNAVYIGNTA